MLYSSLSYLCFSCLLNNQGIESYRKENSSYEKNTTIRFVAFVPAQQ